MAIEAPLPVIEVDTEVDEEDDVTPLPSSEVKKARKGELTRQHLVQTALDLFREKGYQATTLREIAARAGTSLGLTYRYFNRKEELVFALYEQLSAELAQEIDALPPGSLSERFGRTMEANLHQMGPHREALAALFAVGLSPDSELAVLGPGAATVRERVWKSFRLVIIGAGDAPRRATQVDELATVLYATHLSFVLFWLQDRTPNQHATRELIAFATEALGWLRPALRLPPVAHALTRLVRSLGPMFGGSGSTEP